MLRAAAIAASIAFAAEAAPNPKRGYVADGCTGDCQDPTLLSAAGWYYDYNPGNPYTSDPLASQRFVPMHWCLPLTVPVPAGVNTTYLLGPNEPNNVHNCNTNASVIAAAWRDVMRLWPDSKLVSPATAGNGIPWLDEFFAACKQLYGPSGCKLSAVAVHDYSCTPDSTMSYLKTVNERYGLPVWLTEFSCGDGAQGEPTSKHLAFMQAIVPLLDAAPYVQRYAWMSAHDKSGRRGLVEVDASGASVLTELGQLYNSL